MPLSAQTSLLDQFKAQKARMISNGATNLRAEMSEDTMVTLKLSIGDLIEGIPFKIQPAMEGFAILADWPEANG